MDRIWASTDGNGDLASRSTTNDFALPSRGDAIDALRPALEAQAGPVLLTGEAGVGKTWLGRRLQAEMSRSWRWLVVDVPPAINPTALYHLVGHALGLPGAEIADGGRLALADFLREASADGVRWALVLDEAHNASAAVLEEVRLLANRLGHPDGPAALLLVGQTALACRLAQRPSKALAVRLAGHVHLRGLDVDETRALLKGLAPALDWDDRTLERHHRDAGGNPRRLLRIARGEVSVASASATPARRLRERPGVASPPPLPPERTDRAAAPSAIDLKDDWETPVIGALKPPLRVGDGMIEVGWEPEPGPEPEPTPGNATNPPTLQPTDAPDPTPTLARETMAERLDDPGTEPEVEPEPELEAVETVNDHYAALQAWNEWERNQGRVAVAATLEGAPARVDAAGRAEGPPHGDPAPVPPGVWIEGQQGFAPYGQLFSRLKQVRDNNESS